MSKMRNKEIGVIHPGQGRQIRGVGMRLYVGVDMAKHDFSGALVSSDGSMKRTIKKLGNNPRGWNMLKNWVLKQKSECQAETVHLGVESTGGYEGPMVEWLRKHIAVEITLLNPIQVKRFIQSQLIRTKTDEVDARMIARYMAIHQPNPTPAPAEGVKELRTLTRHLDHLVRKRAEERTYLESVQDVRIKSLVKQMIKSYDKQIAKVEKQINDHLDQHPDLKKNKELLTSIPGIGCTTAGILLSEINRSLDPKQQVAHAGLAPRERQSGMHRGKSQLCKTGSRRLRSALFMPTLAAIRCNPVIRTFYLRLLARGKPRMVVVAACMRKLLHIAIGVLKNQNPFDPEYEQLSLAS